mgnify:CR=1 FL=1
MRHIDVPPSALYRRGLFKFGGTGRPGSSDAELKNTMTLERVREIITQQLQFGGGYNRNAVRLLLGEVQREHGPMAMDAMIRELGLEQAFGLKPGTDFSNVGR